MTDPYQHRGRRARRKYTLEYIALMLAFILLALLLLWAALG